MLQPRIVVLAPYRGGDPDRDRAWAVVRPYYESFGWPVYTADAPGPRFNISGSYNAAAREAGDWDLAVIINADCVVNPEQLRAGVTHAVTSAHLTLPHDDLRRIRRGRYPEPPIEHRVWFRNRTAYGGPHSVPAGVVLMPRVVWDRIGGYDERFEGWGFEDAAMLRAAGEYDRLPGVIYHYDHITRKHDIRPGEPEIWEAEYRHRPMKEHLVNPGSEE